jgi:hypothetical protein
MEFVFAFYHLLLPFFFLSCLRFGSPAGFAVSADPAAAAAAVSLHEPCDEHISTLIHEFQTGAYATARRDASAPVPTAP